MYTRNAPPEGFDARCWERHSSRDLHITWRVAKKHQVTGDRIFFICRQLSANFTILKFCHCFEETNCNR